jgi:transposase
MFEELGIGEHIDKLLPQDLEQRKVSLGTGVKAMIINGLGFTNHALYLVPKFFDDKPVERLLGAGISAEMLNDDMLGRTLDSLYDYDVTSLYSLSSQITSTFVYGKNETKKELDEIIAISKKIF